LKPKHALKDVSEFVEVISLSFSTFTSPYKRMTSIGTLSLGILVWRTTLIGLDLPLASLISITEKRKKILTCTQETTRAKLERLRSAILIHRDQTNMTRHAMALIKANGLISLLAHTLSTINHDFSQIKLINMRRFAS
jgi:hypothetical protein